jgi:O-antigen/teichoic acid export membrane protein
MSELKKNITYTLVLTGSRFLFPIVTYPYLSRVLGPEKIGLLNFSESFSYYFVLIAALGIPLYGVREIAKVKHNPKALNKVFTEISIIYLASTLLTTLVFLFSVFTIPLLRAELTLNLVFGTNLLVSFLSFEWFLIGIEKFKYIAIRSIVTKLVPIMLMFFLVRSDEDYILYQELNILAFLINALSNIWLLRNYVKFDFKTIAIKQHLRPMVSVFISSVFISFYSLIDGLILGFVSTFKSVGFYATAIKLNRIVTLIIASIGNVLVPRISSLLGEEKREQAISILNKSLNLTILLTIPLSVGLFLLSSELIIILSGVSFEEAILPSQIISPIIFLMGLSNVFSIQILLPFSREKDLLKLFLITTVASCVLNMVLAFKYDYIGSASAMLITEIILTFVSFLYARRVVPLKFPWKLFFISVLASLMFIPIVFFIKLFFENVWIISMLSGGCCVIVYFLVQILLFRDYIMGEMLIFFKSFLSRK